MDIQRIGRDNFFRHCEQFGFTADHTPSGINPSYEEFHQARIQVLNALRLPGCSSALDQQPFYLFGTYNDPTRPSYHMVLVTSREDVLNITTIRQIHQAVKQLDPAFRLAFSFEYNQQGYDFMFFFSHDRVLYYIGDEDVLSEQRFGFTASVTQHISAETCLSQ